MPSDISAPRRKLPATAVASLRPRTPTGAHSIASSRATPEARSVIRPPLHDHPLPATSTKSPLDPAGRSVTLVGVNMREARSPGRSTAVVFAGTVWDVVISGVGNKLRLRIVKKAAAASSAAPLDRK